VRDSLRIAYVVRSWPRFSQTFVVNEIRELERIGVPLSLFALARAGDALVQAQVAEVAATVGYLDAPRATSAWTHLRLLATAPSAYLATLWTAFRRRELFGGYTQLNARQAFLVAVRLAGELHRQEQGAPFTHLHAHFAHDPALVALLAHRLTGIPFSFTGHARDVYQIPTAALAGRVREATAVVTCCQANVEHIRAAAATAAVPVELIYHGVDLARFQPPNQRPQSDVPLILSVGRLIEKKGFDDLLRACAILARSARRFRCQIFGDGPSSAALHALRDRLGLQSVVRFEGACTQDDLLPVYQRADIFALTPRVADDGDRDGIPNVLLEAMACGVPVVSTRVAGVPEVVRDGANGVLVASSDADAVADGLTTLLDDDALRRQLGAAALRTAQGFDSRHAALRLAQLFRNDGAVVTP
jgi:glycosyltransferase involved in cell wall biosynthesis